MKLGWYARRLASMSVTEVRGRVRDTMLKGRWRNRQVTDANDDPLHVELPAPQPKIWLDDFQLSSVPEETKERIIKCANAVLDGRFHLFDRERTGLDEDPDWFLDARTGSRGPDEAFAFDIDIRDVETTGTVKYIWEPSRHYHLTVLAAGYFLTKNERYARHIARQLDSWWRKNPFMTGVHWTSGIELGVRLISWVWIRRLLDGWSDTPGLFEENKLFLQQLHHHQDYLATFPSHGTSANNHVLAEMAGLFASACAFPYFPESDGWREMGAEVLTEEIPLQTFESGLNKELASSYHAFVLELVLAAAVEGEMVDHSLGGDVWLTISRMIDALAAVVDCRGRLPRQGDGDDAHGLLLDDPQYDQCGALLNTGNILFGAASWWLPVSETDFRSLAWRHMIAKPSVKLPEIKLERPATRPFVLGDAGQTFLIDRPGDTDEIWCRCDHGPHGYLAIAAHGHADALSVEVRYGGVDILVDPGTYTYQGEPEWRQYFRSTAAHNCLELEGTDQSVSGGPFLWTRTAKAKLIEVKGLDEDLHARWRAEHDGYQRLKSGARIERTVDLNREKRILTVADRVDSQTRFESRLFYHLGPTVECELLDHKAVLRWNVDGAEKLAIVTLPNGLSWKTVRGQEEPPLGWYSPTFGAKNPITTLVGEGLLGLGQNATAEFLFDPPDHLRP